MKRIDLSRKLVNFDGTEFRESVKDMLLGYLQATGAQQLLPSLTDKGIAFELWKEIGRANGELTLKQGEYELLQRVCNGIGNVGSWSIVATQQVKQMIDAAETVSEG